MSESQITRAKIDWDEDASYIWIVFWGPAGVTQFCAWGIAKSSKQAWKRIRKAVAGPDPWVVSGE